jgi:hypothetical protein
MTLFALFALVATATVATTLRASSSNRGRVVASGLVSQELDIVGAASFSSIASFNGRTTTEVVGPTKYTISDTVQDVSPPAGSGDGVCNFNAAGTDGQALVVNVGVTWPNTLVGPVVGQVELSPPADLINALYANLTIDVTRVVGANTPPVVGATVSINTVPVQTVVTDANGCASFVSLPPGVAYTVTSTGLIDQSQGDQGSSPAVAQWTTGRLAPSSYNSQSLLWDTPAVLASAVSLPAGFAKPSTCTTASATPGPCPSGTALGLSINLQAGQRVGGSPADTILGITAPQNVYPFSAGWGAWTGDCADAATTPYLGHANTTAGGHSTVTAPAAGVTVTSGSTGKGTVYAYNTADTSCQNGEILSWTEASGWTGQLKLAIPAGGWIFYQAPNSSTSSGLALNVTGGTNNVGTMP